MVRAYIGNEDLAQIGELDLQTFDFQANNAAARKVHGHDATRCVPLREFHVQEVEPCVLVGWVNIATFAAQNAFEAQRGTAASVPGGTFRLRVDHRCPTETVE